MKIGLVCPYNIFRPGGVQTAVLAHYKELKSRGHSVHIIVPKPRVVPVDHDLDDLILVAQSTEFNTPFHTMVDLALRVDLDELQAVLDEYQFDILHVHEPWIPRMPMQLLELSKARNIATFHAKLPESFINKSFEKAITPYTKQVFKNLHYLTAVSEAAAGYVSSIAATLPVEIIPNGIDLEVYQPDTIEPLPQYNDGRKNILSVSRLEKRKGTIHLLQAYEKLSKTRDDVRLIIASDGHKRQMLENFVEDHHLQNVEFLGFVSEEDKMRLLRSADIFCSPALYGESFGVVLLEAMAMGVVTVCGNNAGYTSVMKDRGRLSLVDPRMVDEFTHRLDLMLSDQEVRTLWKDWASEYVKQFDYRCIVDRYEKIYQELLVNEPQLTR